MTAEFRERPSRFSQQSVLKWVALIVALIVAYFFVTRAMPRWWATRVSSVVDSSLTTGWLFGIFVGFVFTVVPLVVLWIAFRVRGRERTWKGWLGWLAVAALTALPNLMTLGVVLGTSSAAHAAERKFDTEGDGFRAGTVLGVVLGVVGALFLTYLVRTRGMFRDQNRRLRHSGDEA